MKYLGISEKKKKNALVETLSQFPLVQELSSEHINTLLSLVKPVIFNDDEVVSKQGDDMDMVIFITEGKIELKRDGTILGEAETGSVIGLAAVLANIPNPATARAKGVVKGLALFKTDFNRLMQISPEFNHKCREMTTERLARLEQYVTRQTNEAMRWKSKAVKALESGTELPNTDQLRRVKEEHEGAPLAIWLGFAGGFTGKGYS